MTVATGATEASATIAVYGGSFDPPHIAHVLCAAYVLAAERVDEVLVVPTFQHALEKEVGASFEERYQMTRLAMRDLSRVRMSRIEQELGGKSRTLRTLEALSERHPNASFRLVVGADILNETHMWYRWDRIVELAPPIVVGRGGFEAPRDDVVVLPEVSSTDVRARLRDRRPVTGLIPSIVEEYIEAQGLYAGAAS